MHFAQVQLFVLCSMPTDFVIISNKSLPNWASN